MNATFERQSIPAAVAAPVAVAHGDGIGPEIMEATLLVLQEAGARLDLRPIEIGEAVYRQGHLSGIAPGSWDTLREARVMLKAPITTPQGGGVKSLNVTLRKTLGLYANVRPCVAYSPFVPTNHPDMDLVIVRENEEDLYAGIEHRQTDEVYQCLKIVSRPGCERICRYAFAYARAYGRRKVTCMTKDNIMKLTDGLFHRVFDEVGAEYPEIEREHMIIDIGTARVASDPGRFDVIVTPNLYGDILSDVAAEVAGSVGLAPSANVGADVAMFEAIHGSAPDLAGRDLANPSGLLLSAAMMLIHLGQPETAERVHNAWLRTVEEGIHTEDMRSDDSVFLVGTGAFAKAVIARLGKEPQRLRPVRYEAGRLEVAPVVRRAPERKAVVGVDVFVQWTGAPEPLADRLRKAEWEGLRLSMITNRGVKVWPQGLPETLLTDHWRCRFMAEGTMDPCAVAALLTRVCGLGVDLVKMETLCTFDGEPGYSLGQGQ